MKKLILVLLLLCCLLNCNVVVTNEFKVISIEESYNKNFKYTVKFKTEYRYADQYIILQTNKEYKVGDILK